MKKLKYIKFGLILSALVFGAYFSNLGATRAETVQSIQMGGWAFNGHEQGIEATQITYMLELVDGKGGVSGSASGRNSAYQFEARNDARFSLAGVNLGTKMTVVHSQDWIAVADNLCAGDVSKCNFVNQWGREAKTLSVSSPHVASRRGTANIPVGGWAFNGHEQASEAETISHALSLAQGNGGVSGSSSYRDSYYNFTATNGNYFTLDGVNIGNKISIVHHQDWVGITKNNTCKQVPAVYTDSENDGWSGFIARPTMMDDPSCVYFAQWGRFEKQLGVSIPSLTDICCASSCRNKPTSCTPQVDPAPKCYPPLSWDSSGRCSLITVSNPGNNTPAQNVTCALPNGWRRTAVSVGETVKAYESYYQASSQACETASQDRVCQANGVLSGSFVNESCTVPPPPPPPPSPVSGITGSACDKMTSADSATFLADSRAMCSSGDVGNFQKTFGTYSWTCYGSNGGGNQSCSAPRIVNNVGGSSCGVAFYSKPTGNLCAEGEDPVVSGSGPWTWTCGGGNGGSSAQCVADKKENGSCGSVAQDSYGTAPTSNQCASGSATQSSLDSTGKFWQWSCEGLNGGAPLSCRAANSCGNLKCEKVKGETHANCSSDCKATVTGVNEI